MVCPPTCISIPFFHRQSPSLHGNTDIEHFNFHFFPRSGTLQASLLEGGGREAAGGSRRRFGARRASPRGNVRRAPRPRRLPQSPSATFQRSGESSPLWEAMSSTLAAWVTPPGRLSAATPLWEGAKECAASRREKDRVAASSARLVSESAKRFKGPLPEGAGRAAAGGVTAQRRTCA